MRHAILRSISGLLAIALVGCRGPGSVPSTQVSASARGKPPRSVALAVCLEFTRDTAIPRPPTVRFVVLFDSVPARDTLQHGWSLRAEWWTDTTDLVPTAIGAWSGNPIGGHSQPTYAGFQRTDSSRVVMGITVDNGEIYGVARADPVRSAPDRGIEPVLRGRQWSCRRSPHSV